MDFIIALSILFLGLAACALLISLIVRPIFRSLQNGRAVMRLGMATKQLEQAGDAVTKGDLNRALSLMRRAVIYDFFNSDDLLRTFREHQQNFLSRGLAIAEHLSLHIDNIAEVEHFLLERSELLELRQKLRNSHLRLRQKRKQGGKDTPLWRNDEFEKKMAEVELELAQNKARLARELDKLFSQLSHGPARESVTYH